MLNEYIDPEVSRALERIPIEVNDLGYDPWGFHPEQARAYFTLAKQICRYFRPEVHHIDRVPEGRCLIVPNHSGQFPFDGLVLAVSLLLQANPPRLVRAMAERWFPTIPFVNIAFSRCGVVVGDPINCRNLLEHNNAILAFPEGTRGSGKIFQKRYQLQSFGRGFMRLALQTNAPVVPVGIVGAEESIISIADLKPVAKMLGMPYLPVPALLPLLGPLAFLPLPTKFHIYIGEPLVFEGPFDDEDEVIQEKVDVVQAAVAELIREGREARTSWF